MANQKEATHTNTKVSLLMNIYIKTPERLQLFRRSRAENLVKNCAIWSKKEAREPVSALLILEEVNQAREASNGGPSYRQFSPKRGYQ